MGDKKRDVVKLVKKMVFPNLQASLASEMGDKKETSLESS